MRHLATIKIESLTPSAIGGYDPNIHDDIFRVTSLRGVAAWWLRAIVSGVAYDKRDTRHKEKAIQLQEEIFGGINKSSLIKITASMEKCREIDCIESVKSHIRLHIMGKKVNLKEMLRNFKAIVNVYSSAKAKRSEKYMAREALGLYAIILSLLFSGLGKGSRRGLGAVKLTSISISQDLKDFLQKEGRDGLLNLSGELSGKVHKSTLKAVIEDARKITEKLLEKEQTEKHHDRDLPKIPSLSESAAEIYVKELEDLKGVKSSEERLARLNKLLEKLFLKNTKDPERLLNKLQNIPFGSYILGLPRLAETDGKKGYSGISKISSTKSYGKKHKQYRRASPVIVSMLDEQTAVITLFKSSDWPEELQWSTSNNKSVKALSIDDAYSVVSQYLMEHYEKVWPQ